MTYTFEPETPEGTPRLYVGNYRAPWPPFKITGFIQCSCGTMLQTFQTTREHYDLGHFDRPLYEADGKG